MRKNGAFVEYQATPLPVIHAATIGRSSRLQGLVESDLPGLIIRNVGDSLDEVVKGLRLPPEILCDPEAATPLVRETASNRKGLPIDFDARPNYKETLLGLRFTEAGHAIVRLFRPGATMVERMDEGAGLPPDAVALFEQDRVHPDFLNPTAYKAILTAGSLLIYKAGGPAPLVRNIRALDRSWQSVGTWGVIRHRQVLA